MRKAVIENGIVVNVIECPQDWQAPEGWLVVDAADNTGPGDTWDGASFSKSSEPEVAQKTVFDGAGLLTQDRADAIFSAG